MDLTETQYLLGYIKAEQWAAAIRYARQHPDKIKETIMWDLIKEQEFLRNVELQKHIKFYLGELK